MGDAGPPTPPPILSEATGSHSSLDAPDAPPPREVKVLVTGFGVGSFLGLFLKTSLSTSFPVAVRFMQFLVWVLSVEFVAGEARDPRFGGDVATVKNTKGPDPEEGRVWDGIARRMRYGLASIGSQGRVARLLCVQSTCFPSTALH